MFGNDLSAAYRRSAATYRRQGDVVGRTRQAAPRQSFLDTILLGSRLLLFLVGIADKYERILAQCLNISGRSILLHFSHQIRGLVFRHILGVCQNLSGKNQMRLR